MKKVAFTPETEASADPFNSPQQPVNPTPDLLSTAADKTAAPGQKTPKKGEYYAEKDGDDWSVFRTETSKCYATYSEKAKAQREADRLNDKVTATKTAGDMNGHDDSGLPEKLEQEVTKSPTLGLIDKENKVGDKMADLGREITALDWVSRQAAVDRTANIPVSIQAAEAVGNVLYKNKIPVSDDLLGEISNAVEEYLDAVDAQNPGIPEQEF